MKFASLVIGLLVLITAGTMVAQNCPAWREREALLQFLLDHRSNSTDADPDCVSRAFASLSYDKSYLGPLVKLLDFERSTKNDEKLFARSGKYPAISALARMEAIPQLINAIKESESDLVRTNATEALDLVCLIAFRRRLHYSKKKRRSPTPQVRSRTGCAQPKNI